MLDKQKTGWAYVHESFRSINSVSRANLEVCCDGKKVYEFQIQR